jgi:hypothetical protein
VAADNRSSRGNQQPYPNRRTSFINSLTCGTCHQLTPCLTHIYTVSKTHPLSGALLLNHSVPQPASANQRLIVLEAHNDAVP